MRGLIWAAFVVWGAMVVFVSVAGAGPAINQFEVKDLDSAPGEFEFQSQNAYSTGQPRRRHKHVSGEDFYDDNTVIRQREALEVQVGITEYFRVRVGIEYEQERLEEPDSFNHAHRFGSLILDELALEGVFVFVRPKEEGVGLGLLVEYGHPMSGEADDQKELYVGPIIQAQTGNFSFIANLAFVKFFGGKAEPGEEPLDDKWDFAYFLQAKYDFSKHWTLALEGYGTFDRIGSSGRRTDVSHHFGDHDQHRAGPIAYYTFYPGNRGPHFAHDLGAVPLSEDDDDDRELSVSIGAGVLFGLNQNTPDQTYKLSLEVEY